MEKEKNQIAEFELIREQKINEVMKVLNGLTFQQAEIVLDKSKWSLKRDSIVSVQ